MRNRFEQTSRTLQRKISMRSTKDQLVKRRSYACEKQCFPVEPSGCRRDSPLVSMEIPLRTAYSQAGRCGMQPKAKHSLREQAHQSKSRTETVKTETLEKNLELERERKGNAKTDDDDISKSSSIEDNEQSDFTIIPPDPDESKDKKAFDENVLSNRNTEGHKYLR
ncbi:hypothetical protein TNCV_4332711 [Trichonephila clavipes]|nr:hypothetical protein TNCV_4332711 [Trichonephila clavipes]